MVHSLLNCGELEELVALVLMPLTTQVSIRGVVEGDILLASSTLPQANTLLSSLARVVTHAVQFPKVVLPLEVVAHAVHITMLKEKGVDEVLYS
jgi:hypothetical protein